MEILKNTLIEKINDIINLNNEEWNNFNKNIKIKYIHRLCNLIETEDKNKLNELTIPLKSIKPKKLIQFCGYSKQNNNSIYHNFNQSILNYTFTFRQLYVNIKNKKYYSFSNLPKNEYNLILNDINNIVFSFMNKNKININNLIKNLTGSNFDKIILNINNLNNLNDNYNLILNENIIELKYENFKIIFTLKFSTNNITNNIPVKYYINLINLI